MTATRKPVKVTIESHIEMHDKVESEKLATHVVCIVIGLTITTALSFVPAAFALHFVGVLAGVPSIAQELIDRFIKGF